MENRSSILVWSFGGIYGHFTSNSIHLPRGSFCRCLRSFDSTLGNNLPGEFILLYIITLSNHITFRIGKKWTPSGFNWCLSSSTYFPTLETLLYLGWPLISAIQLTYVEELQEFSLVWAFLGT